MTLVEAADADGHLANVYEREGARRLARPRCMEPMLVRSGGTGLDGGERRVWCPRVPTDYHSPRCSRPTRFRRLVTPGLARPDRAAVRRECRVIYGELVPAVNAGVAGSRPELERHLVVATAECRTDEERIAGVVQFCAGL